MTLVRPPIRTTKLRQGRVTPGQRAALDRLWPALGVEVDGRPLDLLALFGRTAPVVLEIGSGMGEATAALAALEPDRDVLACELHLPGQGSLLRRADEAGLTNVRVVAGDGVVVLRDMLGPGSLDAVRVFFPDPWPKPKHWKRRLVDDAFAALVADRLRPGGVLHVATDWAPYAAQVRRVLHACPDLAPAPPPPRALTRFERQGVAAGRPAHDVAAVRR
ncbi:MAG: putative methyltransferase [Frankiales bacterium]|nr:putative methyltransferase [Frankiales bacterium]